MTNNLHEYTRVPQKNYQCPNTPLIAWNFKNTSTSKTFSNSARHSSRIFGSPDNRFPLKHLGVSFVYSHYWRSYFCNITRYLCSAAKAAFKSEKSFSSSLLFFSKSLALNTSFRIWMRHFNLAYWSWSVLRPHENSHSHLTNAYPMVMLRFVDVPIPFLFVTRIRLH